MAAWLPLVFPFVIPERADAPAANRGAIVTWDQIHKWSFRVKTWNGTFQNPDIGHGLPDPITIEGIANYNFLIGEDDGGGDLTRSYMPNEEWHSVAAEKWFTAFASGDLGIRLGDESRFAYFSWNGGDITAEYGSTTGFFKVGSLYYFVPGKLRVYDSDNFDQVKVTIDGITIDGGPQENDELYLSADLVPASYWTYDPGDGLGPCFDESTGEQIRTDIDQIRRTSA